MIGLGPARAYSNLLLRLCLSLSLYTMVIFCGHGGRLLRNEAVCTAFLARTISLYLSTFVPFSELVTLLRLPILSFEKCLRTAGKLKSGSMDSSFFLLASSTLHKWCTAFPGVPTGRETGGYITPRRALSNPFVTTVVETKCPRVGYLKKRVQQKQPGRTRRRQRCPILHRPLQWIKRVFFCTSASKTETGTGTEPSIVISSISPAATSERDAVISASTSPIPEPNRLGCYFFAALCIFADVVLCLDVPLPERRHRRRRRSSPPPLTENLVRIFLAGQPASGGWVDSS